MKQGLESKLVIEQLKVKEEIKIGQIQVRKGIKVGSVDIWIIYTRII